VVTEKSAFTLPHAVLLGSVVIATAIYLGLREGASPPTRVTPPVPSAARELVEDAVRRALDAHRATLSTLCLPLVDGGASRSTVRFTLNFTFDGATGRQLTRGLVEDRATSNAVVTACVARALPAFAIAPPGANAYVEVPFVLP
jgi:hypothetical protein